MSSNWLLIKRDLYERPEHRGYTGIRDHAGRYSKEEADRHMAHYGPNSAVREDDAPEFRAAAFSYLVIAHLSKQRDTARAEARRAALEEAAKLVEDQAKSCGGHYGGGFPELELREASTAIRALIERESEEW